MDLTKRQKEIVDIVKKRSPITGDEISQILGISRATIRPDLSILTMVNVLGARPKVGYFYTGKSELSLVIEKLRGLLIKDYMSTPVIMDEKTSVYDVIVNLFLEDISSVFITNEDYLSGVVSRKDLIRATLGNMDLKNTPVGLIMSRMPNIAYVEKDYSVYDASIIIEERGVDALPVVEVTKDFKYKIVGKFTKTNINRIFVDICNGDII